MLIRLTNYACRSLLLLCCTLLITGYSYAHNFLAHHHRLSVKSYMHGIASYYGGYDGFGGHLMADGQAYNDDDPFVAAHPTLPLGTKLKVINQINGRIVYVEVKDRMPRGRRVIDLSLAAANSIGMRWRGLARVTLIRISDAEFYRVHSILTERLEAHVAHDG
jgi:rare lipoprotein A